MLEEPSGLALVARGGEQEELGGDVLVAALLGLLVGDVEELRELAREVHLPRRAFHLGKLGNRVSQAFLQGVRIAAGLGDEARDTLVLEQRRKQVLRLDVLVVLPEREALRLRQGLLELGGELVNRIG